MSTSKSSPSTYFSDVYSTILSIKVSTISDVHVYRLDFSLSLLSIFTFVFLLLSLSLLTLLFEVFTSFGEFDDSLFVLTILSNLLILTLRLVLRNILCIVMTWKKHGGLGLGRSKTESECSLYPIHYQSSFSLIILYTKAPLLKYKNANHVNNKPVQIPILPPRPTPRISKNSQLASAGSNTLLTPKMQFFVILDNG